MSERDETAAHLVEKVSAERRRAERAEERLKSLEAGLRGLAEHHDLVVSEARFREMNCLPSKRDALFARKCRELLGVALSQGATNAVYPAAIPTAAELASCSIVSVYGSEAWCTCRPPSGNIRCRICRGAQRPYRPGPNKLACATCQTYCDCPRECPALLGSSSRTRPGKDGLVLVTSETPHLADCALVESEEKECSCGSVPPHVNEREANMLIDSLFKWTVRAELAEARVAELETAMTTCSGSCGHALRAAASAASVSEEQVNAESNRAWLRSLDEDRISSEARPKPTEAECTGQYCGGSFCICKPRPNEAPILGQPYFPLGLMKALSEPDDAPSRTENPYVPFMHPDRPSMVLPAKEREAWDKGYAAGRADALGSDKATDPVDWKERHLRAVRERDAFHARIVAAENALSGIDRAVIGHLFGAGRLPDPQLDQHGPPFDSDYNHGAVLERVQRFLAGTFGAPRTETATSKEPK